MRYFRRGKCTFRDALHPMLVRLCSKSFNLGFNNQELPDVQAGFRKGTGTRDQITNICWIIEKAREFQKKHQLLFHSQRERLRLC